MLGGRPVGSTDTVKAAGALVSVGLTESQLRGDVRATAAVAKSRALVTDKAVTVSNFAAGRGPPTRNVKESLSSEMTRVTETTASPAASLSTLLAGADPPAGETVMKPGYVPGLRPEGLTVTFRVAGVTAAVGFTLSQLRGGD